MSGTVEEANTSAYIAAQFEAMGMSVTEHSYQVPMHHVNAEPSLRICIQGFGGNSACEGPFAVGTQIIQFQHRVDYVIQGFSGFSEYTFQDDVQVADVGNGTDDALWAAAAGSIGYVRSGANVGGNTGIFSKAAENNLAGLIFVNKHANCGQIEANDCVPIFKTSRMKFRTPTGAPSRRNCRLLPCPKTPVKFSSRPFSTPPARLASWRC